MTSRRTSTLLDCCIILISKYKFCNRRLLLNCVKSSQEVCVLKRRCGPACSWPAAWFHTAVYISSYQVCVCVCVCVCVSSASRQSGRPQRSVTHGSADCDTRLLLHRQLMTGWGLMGKTLWDDGKQEERPGIQQNHRLSLTLLRCPDIIRNNGINPKTFTQCTCSLCENFSFLTHHIWLFTPLHWSDNLKWNFRQTATSGLFVNVPESNVRVKA